MASEENRLGSQATTNIGEKPEAHRNLEKSDSPTTLNHKDVESHPDVVHDGHHYHHEKVGSFESR
jgi:hypothetical protein